MVRHPASISVLILAYGGVASADSDGNLCTGPGYVAFDEFAGGGGGFERTLKLIQFGAQGISPPVSVRLNNFKGTTHGMSCGQDVVEVVDWEAIHRVDISDRKNPRFVKRLPLPKPGVVPDSHQLTINVTLARDRPKVIHLATVGPYIFDLVIAVAHTNSRGGPGIKHYVLSRIFQLEGVRRVVSSMELRSALFFESVD